MGNFKLFLVILIPVALSSGALIETLQHCCDLGTNYANDLKCAAPKGPIEGVPKDEEPYCLSSINMCCKAQLKINECNVGIEDAKNGDCITQPGSERKQCCDACNIGKFAGATGQACSTSIGLEAQYHTHYTACCEEVVSTTVTNPSTTIKATSLPPKITTVSKNEPLPSIDNLCDIGDLCAQICIPHANSYRCECNPGYTLMADQISCKEIKAKPAILKRTNRCEMNNPCEHNCVDTGVAIHCTCKEGFQLAKDKRSCKDIDECALGLHTCHDNEICINGEGYYDCEMIDDEEEISDEFYDTKCPAGFKLNGEKQLCDDVDECTIPLICEHGKTCVNTVGSYDCTGGELVCPPGFHYKDSTQDCEDIDECITGQHDCNIESQICLNTKGNFTCIDKASKTTCPAGFKMNPILQNCEDINECLESPDLCSPNGICKNEPGGHTCVPKSGFNSPSPTTRTQTQTVRTTPSTVPKTPSTVRTTLPIKPSTLQTTSSTIHTIPSTIRTTLSTLRTTPTTSTVRTTYTRPTTITRTTVSTPDIVYPTFNPKKPEPPRPIFVSPPEPPRLYTTKSTPRPMPAFVKPNSPTTCQKGYKYSIATRQCVDIDECVEDSQACDHFQDCYNTIGSYVCNCKNGFTKDQTTGACVDVNECQVGSNDCIEGQRCDNTIGSYLCSRVAGCGTGYTLNYASGLCEDDDECLLGTNRCGKLGTNLVCRNIPGSYRCERVNRRPNVIYINYPITNYTIHYSGQSKKCLPGYYMDSNGACQDINECESNPCTRSEKCINLRGRYECISKFECKPGYEINEAGDSCVDINECTRGTHACSATQICKNHHGFHICLCPPGHKLVNSECVDINECDFYKDRICSSNSYCMNTIGSYLCKCKEGFREQASKCIDIDECTETNGLCQQKCVNVWGGYRCSCERGFTLNSDNRTCTDINECEKFKDKYLCIGTCENTPGSYVCRCPSGYKLGSDGRTCQDIDECTTQQPCYGRDTICFNTRGGYECPSIICPPNYIRDPDHKSRCKRDPIKCNYLGSCSDTPEQYTYHFFNLISNLPMVQGPIKFFQMKGPIFETSTSKFNLNVENVKCPAHVERVNYDYFRVNREPRRADISFVRPIQGPQQIELSFEMTLFSNSVYTGRVIAKIFIFVSEHSF